MYTALRLYPGNYDGTDEHIYPTEAVRQRFTEMRKAVSTDRKELSKFLKAVDYSIGLQTDILQIKIYPNINVYLRLAEAFNWNLYRDVNYAYAAVLYPPEEIKRRVVRQYPNMSMIGICGRLKKAIGYDLETLKDTIMYGERRCSMCYGHLMFYLKKLEIAGGVHDPLDLEE